MLVYLSYIFSIVCGVNIYIYLGLYCCPHNSLSSTSLKYIIFILNEKIIADLIEFSFSLRFGHKIKSISFSEWSPAEVAKVEEGGNELARRRWLDRWSESESVSEPDGNDLEALREWIRLKYVEKKWYRPHPAPKPKAEALAPKRREV